MMRVILNIEQMYRLKIEYIALFGFTNLIRSKKNCLLQDKPVKKYGLTPYFSD